MTEPVASHQKDAGFEISCGFDGLRILGHYFAHQRAGRIEARDHDAAHEIAFGEDTDKAAIAQNGYGADIALNHCVSDFENGLPGIGAVGFLILHEIVDARHAPPPKTK